MKLRVKESARTPPRTTMIARGVVKTHFPANRVVTKACLRVGRSGEPISTSFIREARRRHVIACRKTRIMGRRMVRDLSSSPRAGRKRARTEGS